MEDRTNPLRCKFLEAWHEYAVYNIQDVDGNEVTAQGQQSGRYYVLTLDDDENVICSDLL